MYAISESDNNSIWKNLCCVWDLPFGNFININYVLHGFHLVTNFFHGHLECETMMLFSISRHERKWHPLWENYSVDMHFISWGGSCNARIIPLPISLSIRNPSSRNSQFPLMNAFLLSFISSVAVRQHTLYCPDRKLLQQLWDQYCADS